MDNVEFFFADNIIKIIYDNQQNVYSHIINKEEIGRICNFTMNELFDTLQNNKQYINIVYNNDSITLQLDIIKIIGTIHNLKEFKFNINIILTKDNNSDIYKLPNCLVHEICGYLKSKFYIDRLGETSKKINNCILKYKQQNYYLKINKIIKYKNNINVQKYNNFKKVLFKSNAIRFDIDNTKFIIDILLKQKIEKLTVDFYTSIIDLYKQNSSIINIFKTITTFKSSNTCDTNHLYIFLKHITKLSTYSISSEFYVNTYNNVTKLTLLDYINEYNVNLNIIFPNLKILCIETSYMHNKPVDVYITHSYIHTLYIKTTACALLHTFISRFPNVKYIYTYLTNTDYLPQNENIKVIFMK